MVTKRVAVEVDTSEHLRADLYKATQERNQLSAQTREMMQVDDLTRELRGKLAAQQVVIDQREENERAFMDNVRRQWEEREAAERQNREQFMLQMRREFQVELERRTVRNLYITMLRLTKVRRTNLKPILQLRR